MEFERYVESHYERLLRVAAALDAGADAEDLTHSALLKALRKWKDIEHVEEVHAYVRRILVNEFLSARRRAKRFPARFLHAQVVVAPDHAELSAERSELGHLIDALPPRQRATIVLRYFEDLDDAAIAEALQCNQSTVRSNAARALRTLRIEVVGSHPIDSKERT